MAKTKPARTKEPSDLEIPEWVREYRVLYPEFFSPSHGLNVPTWVLLRREQMRWFCATLGTTLYKHRNAESDVTVDGLPPAGLYELTARTAFSEEVLSGPIEFICPGVASFDPKSGSLCYMIVEGGVGYGAVFILYKGRKVGILVRPEEIFLGPKGHVVLSTSRPRKRVGQGDSYRYPKSAGA